jgi:tetraacyldisaccharide 4'-kinase
MDIRKRASHIINLQNPGHAQKMLLLPLTLCSYAYCAVVTARQALYGRGLKRSYRLPCTVIAVGNLTVGGTGKTPTVCLLAQNLQKRGYRVAVVNRGYRGSISKTPQVISDGETVFANPATAGDEACMLAHLLPGIPVVSGKDRVRAGKMAVDQLGARVLILDDGFQHQRLKRNLDIVLINVGNPFGTGHLLPRGVLREPRSALGRAGIILLTKADWHIDNIDKIVAALKSYNETAAVFTAAFKPVGLYHPATGKTLAPEAAHAKKAAAFCSIGDPESFFASIRGLRFASVSEISFPDHHFYTADDYRLITQKGAGCDCIITTDKDIAKIDINMLQTENVFSLRIHQAVSDEDRFIETVLKASGLVSRRGSDGLLLQ